MGTVYKRGQIYWIKYYQDGKPFRESSGSKRKRDAIALLKFREGSIATGSFCGLKPEKTTFEELAQDLLNDYRTNGKKALPAVQCYVKRLRVHFGAVRAVQITTDKIRAYIAARQATKSALGKPPSNALINRELAALKRMFNLGKQAGKIVGAPFIPMLKERNVRKGFFHHRDYLRLKKTLPDYLGPILTLAYFTGMRKGEILNLRWRQVDFEHRIILLDPGTTKNEEPRVLPMTDEFYEELNSQKKLRDERFPECEHLFFNYRTGRPIRDFRTAWDNACEKLKLDRGVFHDFRRTGVRNLVRAGVPEKIAMAISGHKTRSVFDRYNIVNEEDVRQAATAVEAHLNKAHQTLQSQVTELDEARERSSDVTGTIRAQSHQEPGTHRKASGAK